MQKQKENTTWENEKKQIAERKKRMRREQSVYVVFVLSAGFISETSNSYILLSYGRLHCHSLLVLFLLSGK